MVVVCLLFYIGCRVNEILMVCWSFVDFDVELLVFCLLDVKVGKCDVLLMLGVVRFLIEFLCEKGNLYVIFGVNLGVYMVNF